VFAVGRTVYRNPVLVPGGVLAAIALVTFGVISSGLQPWYIAALCVIGAALIIFGVTWVRVVVDDNGVAVRNLRTTAIPWHAITRVGVESPLGPIDDWQETPLSLCLGLVGGDVVWALAVRQPSPGGRLRRGPGYAERVAAEISHRAGPSVPLMARAAGWATTTWPT
jgi:hypothetical protein